MTNTELKTIRESRNLTKAAFAALLGTTAMVYGRYESGRSTIPEKISKAAQALAETPDTQATPVDKKVAAVKKAVDTAKSTARKTAKGAARKVAEKVVDDLVDRAVANAKAQSSTPAEVSTPAVEEKAAPTVEDFMSAPITPAPAVEEKTATPIVEEKAEKKKAAPKKAAKKTTKSPSVFIESLSGNQISVEALLTKVPANALSIYVKPGENKAYWVSKRDAGSVDLW